MPLIDFGWKAVRGIIRAAMPEMYQAGLSANAAIRFFKREYGAAYRRQIFLDDWREMTARFKSGPLLEGTGFEDRIGGEAITSIFMKRPRKYRWFAVTTYGDVETGETWDAWTSGYSNSDPYKSVFQDEYLAEIERSEAYPGREVLKMDFKLVFSNRNLGL